MWTSTSYVFTARAIIAHFPSGHFYVRDKHSEGQLLYNGRGMLTEKPRRAQ